MQSALLETPEDVPRAPAPATAGVDSKGNLSRNAHHDSQALKDAVGQQDQNCEGSENKGRKDTEEHKDDYSELQASEADPFQDVTAAVDFDRLCAVALETRRALCNPSRSYCSGKDHIPRDLSCCISPKALMGSYNIVYVINFSDGVTWVARIPGKGLEFEELDLKKMETDYQTMRYIKTHTSIPLPEVFCWKTSKELVGAPFGLMSFMEGSQLSDRWFDQSWVTEEKRLKVLSGIATAMSELGKYPFEAIGALEFDSEGTVTGVGGMVWSNEQDNQAIFSTNGAGWGVTKISGPYESAKDYLFDDLREEYPSKRAKSAHEVMRLAIESIPDYMDSKHHYPLSPMDFNYQNIFVDDDANVVGFIDWDNVHTNPSAMGFARYPSWITRDWDPVNYDYSEDEESPYESSPEELSRYRRHYAAAFESLAIPNYDPLHTRLSHIMEAISIAAMDNVCQGSILARLLEHANCPFQLFDYANAYEKDATSRMDEVIREAFRNMWHAEWETSQETDRKDSEADSAKDSQEQGQQVAEPEPREKRGNDDKDAASLRKKARSSYSDLGIGDERTSVAEGSPLWLSF